ncbi:MAG: acyl-CoA dehydrogenase [Alcaligenaceae bacterium]|nr:acyl-CoA dehydrogenase [Alcaligenaceae bacterium]
MNNEIRTLLSSTFGRLLLEQHTPSYARKTLPADAPSQRALWGELSKGGWLDACSQEFQQEYGDGILLMGEYAGRSLLTLPYGPSTFLANALVEKYPLLEEQEIVLDLGQHPASIRTDLHDDQAAWIDAYGPDAQYLRLSRKQNDWILARYTNQQLEPVPGLDPSIQLARLNGAPLCHTSLSPEHVLPILQNYLAFLLAQLQGSAAASLDMAIAYAKEREQFGKPIGQFQAIKHPLVNAWIALDNGRYAIEALLRAGNTVEPRLANQATRLVTAAAREAVKLSVQVHGGIGFSWEHDCHLYLKRVYRLAVEADRLAPLLYD